MRQIEQVNNHTDISGVLYAVAAFSFWGVLPLYWKVLRHVPAPEILAHRILWSFVFLGVIMLCYGKWDTLKEVMSLPAKRRGVFAGGVILSLNWLIFIWAINSQHIVEASLGYYINPLINVALGMFVLHEKLNLWQIVSIFLAFLGVLIMTVRFGSVPWIALSLAISFALYGLIKKMTNIDSLVGLLMETLFVMPAALVYLIFKGMNGTGALGSSTFVITMFLMGAGIVTALPLLWFSQGALRIPLSTVGIIQYLSPSISLLIGVLIFKEPFTNTHMISFAFIWCALALYSLSRLEYFK